MARKKKYDNVTRAELGKLNRVRDALWDLGGLHTTLKAWCAIDNPDKAESLRTELLEQIYDTERFLKVMIFEHENPHLA